VGQTVPSDPQALACRLAGPMLCMGRVHPVPGLRRRDQTSPFLYHAIESLNARYRRTVTARGHFPNEQAALKCLYLVTRGLDPKGTGQARWVTRWKPALNAFAVTFAERMPAAENL